MNKLPANALFALIAAIFLLAAPLSCAHATPSITLDPASITVAQNAQFTINVKINSDSTNISGADATINYAGNDLEFISASSGNHLPVFTTANNPAGTLEIHAYTLSTYEVHTGTGILGTLRFKAKKGSGSSSMTFACTNNGHDTAIRALTGENILSNCSSLNQALISYTGTTVTNTNTPTATIRPGTPTPTTLPGTPTPTSVPGTNTIPTCASLYTDISSAVGAPLAVKLTCSGIDPDGYMNAAEFTFGDGTKQVVEKNAGSPGSIETTHTYTTIGTFGTSCRVRDNNSTWSSVPENCNKILTIKSRPASTPTPTSSSYGGYGTSSPTPTTVAMLVTETPTPMMQDTPEPTLYPEETAEVESETSSSRIWWIIGGIVAVILAYLLLRRKEPNVPPYIPPVQPPVQPPYQPPVNP